MDEKTNVNEISSRFNEELDLFLEGKIGNGHIFKLGKPGEILQKTGFPVDQEIVLLSEQLKKKANSRKHPFDPRDLKNLVKAINEPVAVFTYEKKKQARNVIIGIKQNDKNYLVGIHFENKQKETSISEIRGLYPKDTAKWLNWINQGKHKYLNIEKLQAVVTHLQPNAVGMDPQNLESINKLLQEHSTVKGGTFAA